MKVNHINVPDKSSNIYCQRIKSIIHLDKAGKFWKTCRKCPMFNGTYQGEGVECLYEDSSPSSSTIYNYSPKQEMLKLTKVQ